ncbi:MAG: hypothetical protein V4496_02375 [Pseudomonadota bacterium]
MKYNIIQNDEKIKQDDINKDSSGFSAHHVTPPISPIYSPLAAKDEGEDSSRYSSINIQNYAPPSLRSQQISFIFSVIFGIGASIKQWAGSESFFQQWVPKKYTPIIGFVSAIAPCAFYYSNNKIIFTHIRNSFKKNAKNETYFIGLPQLTNYGVHQRIFMLDFFLQILFGLGHAASAFGMVYSNFPSQLDKPVLKETILICLSISNFCFGIDKAKKVTDDITALYEKKFLKELNILKKESELIVNILTKYEDFIHNFFPEDVAESHRIRLKENLCKNLSFPEIIKIIILDQRLIHQGIKNIPTINQTYSMHDKHIFFVSRVSSNQCHAKLLRCILSILSISILLANAVYYIAGVPGVSSGLQLTPPYAYFLCVLGAFSSWGQNKIYADSWKDNFLMWCNIDKTILLQSDEKILNCRKSIIKLITLVNFIGCALAILQAISGVFFMNEALNFLSFLTALGYTGKYFLVVFCMLSVGLMLTAAKAEPTIYLLKMWWNKLYALLCCKKTPEVPVDEKEVSCLDYIIKNILRLMQILIENDKDFIEKVEPFFVENINKEIVDILEREDTENLRVELCKYLLEKYALIKEKVTLENKSHLLLHCSSFFCHNTREREQAVHSNSEIEPENLKNEINFYSPYC